MALKDRLKLVRKHVKLNQDDFSKEVGIGIGKIKKIESSGQDTITADDALKIATFCSINLNWLITGQGEMLQGPLMEAVTEIVELPYFHIGIPSEKFVFDPERATTFESFPRNFTKGGDFITRITDDSMKDFQIWKDTKIICQFQDFINKEGETLIFKNSNNDIICRKWKYNTHGSGYILISGNKEFEEIKTDLTDWKPYALVVCCYNFMP